MLSYITTILLSLALLFAAPDHLQPAATLRVLLLDEAGQPVQATLTVRDAISQEQLGTTTTDATGRAVIANIRAEKIRLLAEGTLSDRVALRNEPDGMLIWLTPGSTDIFLRVLADGLLTPDPSEVALEGGSEPVYLPTAPLAPTSTATPLPTVVPLPVATSLPTTQSQPVSSTPTPTTITAPPAKAGTPLLAQLLMVVIIGGIGTVMVLRGKV